MFSDINQVELLGNITNDLNLRATATGTSVLSFGIATNRRYKSQSNDEWQEETTFHNIVVWGRQAEQLAQRAKKGTRLFITGRLATRSWDGQDGKKNYKTEIIADKISLIDRFEKGKSDELPKAEFSNGASGSSSQGSNNYNSLATEIDPDDLPF